MAMPQPALSPLQPRPTLVPPETPTVREEHQMDASLFHGLLVGAPAAGAFAFVVATIATVATGGFNLGLVLACAAGAVVGGAYLGGFFALAFSPANRRAWKS